LDDDFGKYTHFIIISKYFYKYIKYILGVVHSIWSHTIVEAKQKILLKITISLVCAFLDGSVFVWKV